MKPAAIGGDLHVNRLGFGAMRITGPHIIGPPADRNEALKVLRRLPELNVNFVDTAESYGPYISEELIGEVLAPYSKGTVIATKSGLTRTGPDQWLQVGLSAFHGTGSNLYYEVTAGGGQHRPVARPGPVAAGGV